ncbi:MAG TPA: hypothetical protein VIL49_05325 [Capillimicrobium sp.]|jgi:hypothetical protein
MLADHPLLGRSVAVLAATIAAVLSPLASPARALPPAYNNGVVYLRGVVPPNFGISCVERRIRLDHGHYYWRAYVTSRARPDLPVNAPRWIQLRYGWYVWSDCIAASMGSYVHCAYLDEEANGLGDRAAVCHWPPARTGDGMYDFGSQLTWHPPI